MSISNADLLSQPCSQSLESSSELSQSPDSMSSTDPLQSEMLMSINSLGEYIKVLHLFLWLPSGL